MKIIIFVFFLTIEILGISFYYSVRPYRPQLAKNLIVAHPVEITPSPTPPPPTVTPTPIPLSFSQLNSKYGPCARVPTLMYHHIQSATTAKAEGHSGLAVSPEFFIKQLEYIKDHGYDTIKISDLDNFFDHGLSLPPKPLLLTFDDGYDDFFTTAYPLLRQFNLSAVMFLPTGLVNNPGYLTWDNINSMSDSGLIYFANHTWSHRQLNISTDIIDREITTADTQLSDHHQNQLKVFAYPYGTTSQKAIAELTVLNYQLAFTTRTGSILAGASA